MKPITEQRRQELIADCVREIERLEKTIRNIKAMNTDFDLSRDERKLSVHKIALASLTAKVFMHGISDPDGKAFFSECCVDDDGGGVSDEVCALNDGETDVDGGYQVVKLYTAPPVPVIKFPDDDCAVVEIGQHYAVLSSNERRHITRMVLNEIKRLNALGE